MNINKYSKCDKFQIPNKHMSLSQEEINDRLVNKIIISSEPKNSNYKTYYVPYIVHNVGELNLLIVKK